MHILEQYSLNCGLKIGKPFIYDKFYPLPFDKYITFNPFGKFNSRKYSFWQEVIEMLFPILEDNNIKIVQIGGPNEQGYDKCHHMMGHTNINQTAFIVKNSLLHFGVDSFAIHLASCFQKKIVGLYCNMYSSNSKPYWSNQEDVILLQAELNGKKPSFSAEESPKTIDSIKPENICDSVLKLLGINEKSKIKTHFIGKQYGNLLIESTPSFQLHPNIMSGKQLNIRFDYKENISEFDYDCLIFNLKNRPCSIITDKKIDLNKIKPFKNNITNIFYDVTLVDNLDIEFIKQINSNSIKLSIIFDKYKSNCLENLNKKKIDLLDLEETIIVIEQNKNSFDLNKINSENLFYKSKKLLFANNNVYASKRAYLENQPLKQPIDILNSNQKLSEILNRELLISEESDFLYVFEKN
jgi:hypothetical protein